LAEATIAKQYEMNLSSMAAYLRCPRSGQKLRIAGETVLEAVEKKRAAGALFRKSGTVIEAKIERALATRDSGTLYPTWYASIRAQWPVSRPP
jgi:hypothetical protein